MDEELGHHDQLVEELQDDPLAAYTFYVAPKSVTEGAFVDGLVYLGGSGKACSSHIREIGPRRNSVVGI